MIPRKKTPKPKEYGKKEALVLAYRVRTLRAEGFTEGEIRVLMDRRFSTPGMKKFRRERAKELKGLTVAEKREWAAQNEQFRNEETAIDYLRKVSPEF